MESTDTETHTHSEQYCRRSWSLEAGRQTYGSQFLKKKKQQLCKPIVQRQICHLVIVVQFSVTHNLY